MGQEKAGKRSVVEMMLGTFVPHGLRIRETGPTELYCFHSPDAEDAWRVFTSLRFYVDEAGNELATPEERCFGGDCTDREAANHLLHNAQMEVLNPDKTPRYFPDRKEADRKGRLRVEYRRHCPSICIRLYSRHCPDLAVLHMPSECRRGGL